MKTLRIFLLLLPLTVAMAVGLQNCKKTKPEPVTPDSYTFLNGTWRYANGVECLYDAAMKTAKGTKVPANNTHLPFAQSSYPAVTVC